MKHGICRLFGLCVVLIAPSSAVMAQALDPLDTATADAARSVATEEEGIEQMRRICTQVYPNEKRGLATYVVVWRDQNREEILGVRSWKDQMRDAATLDAQAREAATRQLSI